MIRKTLLPLGLVAALGLTACSDDVTGPNDQAFVAEGSPELQLKPGDATIAEIADAEGFTLLLGAVEYIAATNPESELIAGLLNDDQYTVFAPTDEAFGNLVTAVSGLVDPDVLATDGPFAAIDDLLGAGTIEAVVSYHVTDGRRSSNSVLPKMGERRIKTLLGARISVDGMGMIDAVGSDAKILLPDVSASNGVIHVIDTVLLPVDLGL